MWNPNEFADKSPLDDLVLSVVLFVIILQLWATVLIWQNRKYGPVRLHSAGATIVHGVAGCIWALTMAAFSGVIPATSYQGLSCTGVIVIGHIGLGLSAFGAGLDRVGYIAKEIQHNGRAPRVSRALHYWLWIVPTWSITLLVVLANGIRFDANVGTRGGECVYDDLWWLVIPGSQLWTFYWLWKSASHMGSALSWMPPRKVMLGLMTFGMGGILFLTYSGAVEQVWGRNALTLLTLFLAVACFAVRVGRPLLGVVRGGKKWAREYENQMGAPARAFLSARGGDATVAAAVSALEQPLIEAAINGDLNKLKMIVRLGDDVNTTDALGRTVLHHAAQRSQIDIVKHLLTTAKVSSALVDTAGNSVLHYAALSGDPRLLEWLVLSGAGGDVRKANSTGDTFLHVVVTEGHVNLLNHLASAIGEGGMKAIVNIRNARGETPLMLAGVLGYVEMGRVLVGCGAVPAVTDTRKRTVMHHASLHGNETFVRWLLAECKMPADSRDAFNQTPLHHAAGRGHMKVCEILQSFLADVNAVADGGATPLSMTQAAIGSLATQDDVNLRMTPLIETRDHLVRRGAHLASSWLSRASGLATGLATLVVLGQLMAIALNSELSGWTEEWRGLISVTDTVLFSNLNISWLSDLSVTLLGLSAFTGWVVLWATSSWMKANDYEGSLRGVVRYSAGMLGWLLSIPFLIPITRSFVSVVSDCYTDDACAPGTPVHTLRAALLFVSPMWVILMLRLVRVEGSTSGLNHESVMFNRRDRVTVTARRLHWLQADMRNRNAAFVVGFAKIALAALSVFADVSPRLVVSISTFAVVIVFVTSLLTPKFVRGVPNGLYAGGASMALFLHVVAFMTAFSGSVPLGPAAGLTIGLVVLLVVALLYRGVRELRRKFGFRADLDVVMAEGFVSYLESTKGSSGSVVENASARAAANAVHRGETDSTMSSANTASSSAQSLAADPFSMSFGRLSPLYEVRENDYDMSTLPPSAMEDLRQSRMSSVTSLRVLRLGSAPLPAPPQLGDAKSSVNFGELDDFSSLYDAGLLDPVTGVVDRGPAPDGLAPKDLGMRSRLLQKTNSSRFRLAAGSGSRRRLVKSGAPAPALASSPLASPEGSPTVMDPFIAQYAASGGAGGASGPGGSPGGWTSRPSVVAAPLVPPPPGGISASTPPIVPQVPEPPQLLVNDGAVPLPPQQDQVTIRPQSMLSTETMGSDATVVGGGGVRDSGGFQPDLGSVNTRDTLAMGRSPVRPMSTETADTVKVGARPMSTETADTVKVGAGARPVSTMTADTVIMGGRRVSSQTDDTVKVARSMRAEVSPPPVLPAAPTSAPPDLAELDAAELSPPVSPRSPRASAGGNEEGSPSDVPAGGDGESKKDDGDDGAK